MVLFDHILEIDGIKVRVKSRSKDKVNPQTYEHAKKYAQQMKSKQATGLAVPKE